MTTAEKTSDTTSTWDANTAPPLSYLVVPHGTREWRPSWCEGLVDTDLGFAEASDGRFDAIYMRTEGSRGTGNTWPGQDEDLCFLLVLDGELELDGRPGEHLMARRSDAIVMPRGWRPTQFHFSHELACVVLRAPTVPSDRLNDVGGPVVSQLGPHSYTRASSGARRPYFEYRHFGLAELTGGLIGLNVLRGLGVSEPGGTGRHFHTACQWNMTLSGWYDITVEDHESKRLFAGDSTFTPTEAVHHVTAYSHDNTTLNMTMPAEFSTTDV